jgi:cupin fold WbuC family metalloprotein
MMIESKKGIDYPPHAHTDAPELISIISGELVIEFYDSESEVPCEKFQLNAGDAVCTAVLIPQGMVHTTKAQSTSATYLEVKLGPYSKEAVKFYKLNG